MIYKTIILIHNLLLQRSSEIDLIISHFNILITIMSKNHKIIYFKMDYKYNYNFF